MWVQKATIQNIIPSGDFVQAEVVGENGIKETIFASLLSPFSEDYVTELNRCQPGQKIEYDTYDVLHQNGAEVLFLCIKPIKIWKKITEKMFCSGCLWW